MIYSLFPRQKITKISKMEKSIIFASFLLILSITTTFLKNCNYDTQFPNQKLTCKISQTTAGIFSTRAPPSFAKNSPPPQQIFDWFCQHKYKPKKLYSHNFIFSNHFNKFEIFAKEYGALNIKSSQKVSYVSSGKSGNPSN